MATSSSSPLVFRSEFTVSGDLVAAAPTEALRIEGRGGFTTTLRNAEPNENGEVPGLYAVVIGPSESIDKAMQDAREALAGQLDVLAFATHSRYRISAPVRTMDWMPGLKTICIRWFYERDERFPPAPELSGAYAETASMLDSHDLPGYVRTALRAFRRGLLEAAPEDQVMGLWLALEVIAENTKDKESAPITCSKCRGQLVCSSCSHVPMRVPMPKEQISKLIRDRTGDRHAKGVAKGLFIARNGLMHGRSVESIAVECGGSIDAITNALANVVWTAIYQITNRFESQGAMMHRQGQFLSRLMLVQANGSFEHDGTEPFPREGSIPTVKMRPIVELRSL